MFIHIESSTTVNVSIIRRENPNISLPRNPSDESLAALGYARIHSTPRPEGDVVTQGQPEQREDGKWYQTWEVRSYTAEELSKQLQQVKERRSQDMDNARDEAFKAGMPYAFSDGEDVVQTSPQDQVNLIGLANKAQRQISDGDTTPIPFRALSNVTRMLTPAETDAMALAALEYIEGVYGRTWQAKDAVEAATTIEEVNAIQW